jgi:phospho-N-acetylmuramoyl-pentapeptide-transferase
VTGFALVAMFVVVLASTLLLGGELIAFLNTISMRQYAYEDAPKTHAAKTGTPTMGGLLFGIALVAACVWHPDRTTFALAFAGLGCGAIGVYDDLLSIRKGRNRGLRARTKFLLTAIVAVVFLAIVQGSLEPGVRNAIFSFDDTSLRVPYWLWYALSLVAILATTHAVNLTDGLDGLAAGTILPPLAVFAWFGWRTGAVGVTFVDVAVAAGTIGFLAYNRHPARVFMGDTGALALGGILAASAVVTGTHLLLPLVGGVFAAEAVSVILQVTSFKLTRKRIFRMSPLHHHFELGGLPETAVTARFWTASALLSLAGAAIVR